MNVSYDEKLLIARVQDAIRISEQKGVTKYLGFLDMHQCEMVKSILSGLQYNNFCFYGGYGEAERVLVGFFPYFEI